MMKPEEIEQLVRGALSDVEVQVGGDGRHFQAVVVSPDFEGVPRIKRHRMVYDALREHIDGDVLHAISMQTMTPAERERKAG